MQRPTSTSNKRLRFACDCILVYFSTCGCFRCSLCCLLLLSPGPLSHTHTHTHIPTYTRSTFLHSSPPLCICKLEKLRSESLQRDQSLAEREQFCERVRHAAPVSLPRSRAAVHHSLGLNPHAMCMLRFVVLLLHVCVCVPPSSLCVCVPFARCCRGSRTSRSAAVHSTTNWSASLRFVHGWKADKSVHVCIMCEPVCLSPSASPFCSRCCRWNCRETFACTAGSGPC